MQKKNPSARRSGAAGVSAKSAAARAPEAPPPLSFINRLRTSPRPLLVWLPLALALLASLVALANDFACDDAPQILKNPLLKSLTNLPAAFTAGVWRFAPPDIAAVTQSYYRPLFNAWLMISNALFGERPWGWHLLALLLHAAATGMVYVVVRELFERRRLALVAACLFAVLPVHAEAVAWVSGSAAVLMALLLFTALAFYLRYRKSGKPHQLALTLAFYLLALWGMEAALAFPLVVAYLELTPPRQSASGKGRGVSFTMLGAGLLLVTAVYALMRYLANGAIFAADETRLPLDAALLTMPLAIIKYLGLLLWPFGYSYQHYTLPVTSVLDFKLLAPLALVIVLAAVVARYGSRELRFAGAWFLLTLLPVLLAMSRFEIEHLVQERYLYLPSLGFCLALAAGIEWLAARAWLKLPPARLVTALAAALILLYSTAYILHSRHWSDSLAVYRQAVAVAPDSAAAHSALAIELAATGRIRDAEASARRAVELDPQYVDGRLKLSFLMQQQGGVNKAIDELEQAKSSIAQTATNRSNLATLNLNLGMLYSQKRDYPNAIDAAQQSLALWPRATGYFYAAFMHSLAKQYEAALPLYQEASRRLPPGFAPIHLSLGDLYGQLGRFEEARDEYQKYLALAPPDAPEVKSTQELLNRVNNRLQNSNSDKPAPEPPRGRK
ncbi:MAG TPA: tetratricopeptide repeat protein [Blastocatellia bacterium]|nr:tetratricopeptide repeat protein [Blastocatellia bacterium]